MGKKKTNTAYDLSEGVPTPAADDAAVAATDTTDAAKAPVRSRITEDFLASHGLTKKTSRTKTKGGKKVRSAFAKPKAAKSKKAAKATKQPWEMTQKRYVARHFAQPKVKKAMESSPSRGQAVRDVTIMNVTEQKWAEHKRSVRAAIKAGKSVPASVLKNYPDLASKVTAKAKSVKAVKTCSAETRAKLSKAGKGRVPWNKGKLAPQCSHEPWNKGKPAPQCSHEPWNKGKGKKAATKKQKRTTSKKKVS